MRLVSTVVLLTLACFSAFGQFVEKPIEGTAHKSLYFYNSQLGFIGGTSIMRTTDGGETWTKVKYNGIDSILLDSQYDHRFYFFNSLRGIAVATSVFGNNGTVLETTDGGLSWKIIFNDTPLNDWPYLGYSDVHFFDGQNGFAVGGDGRRIVTSDAGKTWTRSDLPVKKDFYDIFFVNGNLGFVCGENHILKTVNGGATWTSTELGLYDETFNSIFFTSEQKGFSVTDNGNIYFTLDGGSSWQRYYFHYNNLSRVYFVDSSVGYIAGSNVDGYNILKTTDGGNSWEMLEQTFDKAIYDIYFSNSSTGYICGYNYPSTPYYAKTINGTGNTIPKAFFTLERSSTGYTNCPGMTITLLNKGNPSYAHSWYVNNQLISSDYNTSYQLNDPGSYEVKLVTTNANGTSVQHIESITVQDPKNLNLTPISFRYPNPGCEEIPFYILIDGSESQTTYEVWSNGKNLDITPYYSSYPDYINRIQINEELHGTAVTLTIKPKRVWFCYDESHDTTFTVNMVPKDHLLNMELPSGNIVCVDKPFDIVIHNSLPYLSYIWSNASANQGSNPVYGNGGDLILQVPGYGGDGDFIVSAYSHCGTSSKEFNITRASTNADFDTGIQYFKDESPVFVNKSRGTLFQWDLGENATPRYSTQFQPTGVTYSTNGEKNIRLIVDEGHGCTSQKDTVLFVTDRIPVQNLTTCSSNNLSVPRYREYTTESKVDLDGNLFTVGYFFTGVMGGPNRTNFFLRKYTNQGALAWEKVATSDWFDDYSIKSIVMPYGITLDSENNVYMAINFNMPLIFIDGKPIGENVVTSRLSQQAAIIKFSGAGQLLWTNQIYDEQRYDGPEIRNVYVSDIEIDSKGYLYYNLNSIGYSGHDVVLKDSNETIVTRFPNANAIIKISPNGNFLKRYEYGETNNDFYMSWISYYPNLTWESMYYLFEDPHPSGPKLAFDESDHLILIAHYGGNQNNPANTISFGDHTVPFAKPAIIAAILFEDQWTNAYTLTDKLEDFGFHRFGDLKAFNGSAYVSGNWNNRYWHSSDVPQDYQVIINGDSLKYNLVNSYVLKWNYNGVIEWSNYHKDVIFNGLNIGMNGDVTALGTVDRAGIFNSNTPNPLGFRSSGLRDGFVAQFDTDGKVTNAFTVGTALDEFNFRLASPSCGQFTITGYDQQNSFVKKISLTNSCAETLPPEITVNPTEYTICEDGLGVGLMAFGATRYKWVPSTGLTYYNEGIVNAKPSETTTYTVFGFDNANCYSTKTVKVNVQQTEHDFTYSTKALMLELSTPELPGEDYVWSYGDGTTGLGSISGHLYMLPGTYTVCLGVNNICSQNSGTLLFCKTITVVCNDPVVNGFTAVPAINWHTTINFQPSGDFVEVWDWDFGDQGYSLYTNPSHTYASEGTYNVCVTAIGACGEKVTFCKDVIVSCPTISSLFNYTNTNYTYSFTNQSQNASVWEWSFGDGGTSTLLNPVHTYANNGTFEVCLTAKSDCSTSKYCYTVSITCPQIVSSDFSYSLNAKTVSFQNTSLNGNSYLWDFGNGVTSTEINPSYTFPNVGTYNVCLKAIGACSEQTSCKSIVVICQPLVADFSYSKSGRDISLTNLSSSTTTSHWTFGDGTSSDVADPTHRYSANGTYTVCLTIQGECEQKSICKDIVIFCALPLADFSYKLNGTRFEFTNLSQSQQSETYQWMFGDGSSSIESNPEHEFLQSGMYTVCLTASNQCNDYTDQCKEIDYTITGVEKNENNNTRIFPNPIEDSFTVTFGDLTDIERIEVIDTRGTIIHTLVKKNIQSENKILLHDKSAGVYYLRIYSDGSVVSKVLIKVK